jgi:hypothetical protein
MSSLEALVLAGKGMNTFSDFLPAFVRKYNAGLTFALLLFLLFLGTH